MSEEKQQNIQAEEQYARMKAEYEHAVERYYRTKNDLREHQRVHESLGQLNGDRVAYRIVGDVLVKETVNEAKPYVEQTIGQLDNVVKQMEQFLEKRQTEIEDYAVKNKIGV